MSGKLQSRFTDFDWVQINNDSSAPVAPAGKARLRYDNTLKQLQISFDGQNYVNLIDVGSTEALAREWFGI